MNGMAIHSKNNLYLLYKNAFKTDSLHSAFFSLSRVLCLRCDGLGSVLALITPQRGVNP